MSSVTISSDREERLRQLEDLGHELYRFHAAGKSQQARDLVEQWHETLSEIAPNDEIAHLELSLHQAWNFYKINDYMASERLTVAAFTRLNELMSNASLEETGLPDAERVRRLYAVSCNYQGLLFAGPLASPSLARDFFNEALRALSDDERHWLIRAHILANLATAEEDMGQYEDALRHTSASMAVFESTGQPQSSSEYAHLLVRSGMLLGEMGDEAAEESALRRALDVARAYTLGDNTVLADVQRLVADTLLVWNLTEEAEVLLKQARSTYERTIGPMARFTADTGIKLAQAMWRNGQGGKAVELLRHGVIVSDLHLRSELSMAMEDDRHNTTMISGYHIQVTVAMSLDLPEIHDLRLVAYEVLLRNRAITKQLDRQQIQLQKRVNARGGEESNYSEFLARRRDTSRALLSGAAEDTVTSLAFDALQKEWISGYIRRFETMFRDTMSDDDAERAERERQQLAARLASPADSVFKALAADEALIEYVTYPCIDREQGFTRTFRVAAFICRKGMPTPGLVDLCDEGQLAAATAEYHESIESFGEAFEADVLTSEHSRQIERAGERLRTLIFDPLQRYLDSVSSIYVSGDRRTSVPLSGLPLAGGYLIDWYRIIYVESGLDLLPNDSSLQQQPLSPPAVFCDPDFDYGLPGEDQQSEGFESLPGALHEGDSIAATLGCEVLSGRTATKSAMLNLKSPSLLHICTHGWYLHRPADQSAPAWSEHPRLKVLSSTSLRTWRERCGLVMAGFNAAWAGHTLDDDYDDGLLTAGEAQHVDCEQTELVALSACETGLGEEQYDGVYGLTRAFSIAGAKSVVASQWKIADEASEVLMAKFYDLLIRGDTKSDALRKAALHCRETWPQPYFWAAFTLHGDGGPLSVDGLAMVPAVRRADPNAEGSRAAAAVILARAALGRGNPSLARDYLTQVPAQHRSTEVSALLGQCYFALGNDSAARPYLKASAAAGDHESAFYLGRLLCRTGELTEAEVWLRNAAEGGINAAGLEVIQLLETQDRTAEANQLRADLASAGDPESAYQLGVIAARQGCHAEARQWFTTAASAGSWLAARMLANHFSAHGADGEAERWFTMAASLGDGDAAERLARVAAAQGLPDDALEWHKKAAAVGRAESAYQVGLALEGVGSPDAAYWLSVAAECQVPGALYIMARRASEAGELNKAAEYLQRAAEKGDIDAIAITGALKASMGDLDSGLRLLESAASQGNLDAACQLGEFCASLGRPETAKMWYEQAAKGGNLNGELGLGRLAAAAGDITGAAQHWESAAAHGNIEAQVRLAALYESQTRIDDAREMWESAAKNGNDMAASRLAVQAISQGREEDGRRLLALSISSGGGNCDKILRLIDTDESLEGSRAERGHVPAMRRLLQLATLRNDLPAARKWTTKLSEEAEPEQMLKAAADALLSGDIPQAEDLFLTLTYMGYPHGAAGLARMAAAVDDKPESDRYQQAAERLARAQERLSVGLRALEREGPEASVPHMREAAELGSPAAAAHLATVLFTASLYAEEAGREVDSRIQAEEAAKWAEFALRGGHARCAASLGEYYRRTHDEIRSRELFTLAGALARGR